MKKDMTDLKKLVHELMPESQNPKMQEDNDLLFRKIYRDSEIDYSPAQPSYPTPVILKSSKNDNIQDTEEFVEESLSLEDKEIEMIRKSLDKHNGKRKLAANELGISERTLYRKIKEYNIE
jgi:DNA-binding NtrC family response regulator